MIAYYFVQNVFGSQDLVAFEIPGSAPMLRDVVNALPLRGSMHLRFMVDGGKGAFVWLDLADASAPVPMAQCGSPVVKVLALGPLRVVAGATGDLPGNSAVSAAAMSAPRSPHEFIAAMRSGSADPDVNSSDDPSQPDEAAEGGLKQAAGKFIGGLVSRTRTAVASALASPPSAKCTAVLRALAADLGASVDPRKETRWLKQLWLGAGKKTATISLDDPTWHLLGFRAETPSPLDFAEGGLLALKSLAFFATKHTAKYRGIARARAKCGYPMVCVGVNLVCLIARLTRFGVGDVTSKQRFWPLLESSEFAFYHLFSVAFALFDELWRVELGVEGTFQDYAKVHRSTAVALARLLRSGPQSVEDLMRKSMKAFQRDLLL
jgi:hypothetical protein